MKSANAAFLQEYSHTANIHERRVAPLLLYRSRD